MRRLAVLTAFMVEYRVESFLVAPPIVSGPHHRPTLSSSARQRLVASPLNSSRNQNDVDEDDEPISLSELVDEDDDIFGLGDTEEDWLPDREKAKRKRQAKRIRVERIQEEPAATATKATVETKSLANDIDDEMLLQKPRPTPYNDEQERLIASMGGKLHSSVREPGYLGDCTLDEIATDYSVPVCYLADVLCMWGVPVPIDTKSTRLGDMVTGEQAFAILEAVNSMDIAALQDRYANESLIQLCANWDLDLPEAFAFCVKEGWSLPFGVRTCLRVEQVDELLRVMQRI